MHPLEGIWEMIRAEQGGESSPELIALGVQLEISGNTYVVRFGGQVADRGTFASETEGQLVLTGTEGPNAGSEIPCIYQLVGDRLRVCYGMDGVAPDRFATSAGSSHYLASYRRMLADYSARYSAS